MITSLLIPVTLQNYYQQFVHRLKKLSSSIFQITDQRSGEKVAGTMAFTVISLKNRAASRTAEVIKLLHGDHHN